MKKTLLNITEIATLPDNTPIVVIWSGGNGPHHYFKKSFDGRPVAATEKEINSGRFDEVGKSLSGWPIGFVGQEEYHTRVWRCVCE